MERLKEIIMLNEDKNHPLFMVTKEENYRILYNICDENFNILSDVWFKNIYMFDANGLAIVIDMNGSKNIINGEGKLLLNDDKIYTSIKRVNSSKDTIFRLRDINNLCNYANQEGKLLRQEWLAYGDRFNENGFANVIEANGKCNIMDEKGNFLLNDDTFDGIETISRENKDFFVAHKNDKQNVVDKNLNVICKDMWFDYAKIAPNVKKVLFYVKMNEKYNLMDTEGELLSAIWFDLICSCTMSDKYILVCKNGKYNIINLQGQLVFRGKWFDAKNFSSPIMKSENIMSIKNKNDGFFYTYNLDNIEKGIN